MQEPSIFTKIINGEIPADKIYEDDRVLVFMDMFPVAEGHVLVIPKKQIDHIWNLDDDDYTYLWSVAKKVANHIKEVLACPRVGVIVEGFGVPHAHIHLIPIYAAHDLQKPSMPCKDRSVLTEMAKRLSL